MSLKVRIIINAVLALLLSAGVFAGAAVYDTQLSPEARYEKKIELGNKYLEEGNYEQAIIAFTEALEISPKSADMYAARGEAYRQMKDMRRLRKILSAQSSLTRIWPRRMYLLLTSMSRPTDLTKQLRCWKRPMKRRTEES